MNHFSFSFASTALSACVASLLSILPLSAAAQTGTCPIVSDADLTVALPDFQSWTLLSGGPGRCQFEGKVPDEDGDSWTLASLTLMQQYKSSPKEAAEIMQVMRTEFAKQYTLTEVKLAGAVPGAFRFNSGNVSWWYAQAGKSVLSVMYVGGQEQRAAPQEQGLNDILQKAVTATDQPAAAAAAGVCPQFDASLVRKLLGGKKVEIQQFGTTSCIASNPSSDALMFTGVETKNEAEAAQLFDSMRSDDCTNEALASLGPRSELSYNCSQGNKRASVSFFKDAMRYEYTLVMEGREPTAQERAQLIEQARLRFAR